MKNVLAAGRLVRRTVLDNMDGGGLCLQRRRLSGVNCAMLEYSQHGIPAEVVRLREERLCTDLRQGEVLVKLLAAPVNPADINTIQVGQD
jgi:hypothetical protein